MIDLLADFSIHWWSWISQVTIQSSLLFSLLLLADRLLRSWMWPQLRLALFLLVLIKLALPPGLSSSLSLTAPLLTPAEELLELDHLNLLQRSSTERFTSGSAHPSPKVSRKPGPSQEVASSAATGISTEDRGQSRKLPWQLWLLFVWITGLLGLSLMLTRRVLHLYQDLSSGAAREIPPSIREELERACRLVGLNQNPTVVLTRKVQSPAVFGLFRPMVLIPDQSAVDEDRSNLRNILLHELTHIKRGDLILQQAVLLLHLAFWFNPILYSVRWQIHHLGELCCDATVVRLLRGEAKSYRKTILRAAVSLLPAPSSSVSQLGLLQSGSRIGERLRWLSRHSSRHARFRIILIGLIVTFLGVFVLPMREPVRYEPECAEFTITSATTFTPFGSSQKFLSQIQIYQQEEGGESAIFRGEVTKDEPYLLLNSPKHRLSRLSYSDCEEKCKRPANFLREDSVLGYTTFVSAVRDDPTFYLEVHRAPALGCNPIKFLMVNREGIVVNEPLEIETVALEADAFGTPETASGVRELADRYPQVYKTMLEGIAKLGSLPTYEDYMDRKAQPQSKVSFVREKPVISQELTAIRSGPIRQAAFGGEGSVLFSSAASPAEIRGVSLRGDSEEIYKLGSEQGLAGHNLFCVSQTDQLVALFSLDEKKRGRRWVIRRFKDSHSTDDTEIEVPEDCWPVAMVLDKQDGVTVLMANSAELTLLKYSRFGTLEKRFEVQDQILQKDSMMPLMAHSSFGSELAVLPDGALLVLTRAWIQESGLELLSANLYKIDLGQKTMTPLNLVPPTVYSRLAALYQGKTRVGLEWSDYGPALMRRGTQTGSACSVPALATLFDGTHLEYSGRLSGTLVAMNDEGALMTNPWRATKGESDLHLIRFPKSTNDSAGGYFQGPDLTDVGAGD